MRSLPSCRFLVALSALVALLASGCSLRLQHDLSEEDANEIYVLLTARGIDATKLKEGEGKEARYIINVPKAEIAQAAQELKDNSLPRRMADGLAIFKQTKGMIPTQTEERAMFIEALGGEVSNSLSRIPGVLEVRAIVMIPENNDLAQPEKRAQPSASVLIKYMDPEGKAPISVQDAQEFVAAAVPELRKENVKIIMTLARFVTELTDEPQYKTFLGVRVHVASVGTFKTILGVFALLFILMAGAVVVVVLRKPAPRPTARNKPQEG